MNPSITARDEEFRDAFTANQPEMVALDLGMPGMDGVELTRFLADQGIADRPDRQRIRPPRARIRVPAWRSSRLAHGRAGRKAGPLEVLEESSAAQGGIGPVSPRADCGRSWPSAGAGRARLRMAYQPKISLRDGSLARVEALVRWDDPELGPMKPSHFVPLAEEHGLIHELTQWELRTILGQWLDWREEELDVCIAFNISALSLQHLDFPDLVERMCRALGVPSDRLVLELTEGATQPLVKLMDTLTRFRIKGIGLAIDDFGTGYSSLMQFRQLPFTELKIDRRSSPTCPFAQCRLIVRAITDLAHGLGLTATAEGVETLEQLRLIRELGCDHRPGLSRCPRHWSRRAQRWKQNSAAPGRRSSPKNGWPYGATSKRMPWASGRSVP